MATQTGALLTRLGEETFAEMVADECFVAATVPAATPDERGPLRHAAVRVTSG